MAMKDVTNILETANVKDSLQDVTATHAWYKY